MAKSKRSPQQIVDDINVMVPMAFQEKLVAATKAGIRLQSDVQPSVVFEMRRADYLQNDDFTACFALIEQTSAAAYKNSSRGWKPADKKEEMRERDMWYILVRRKDSPLCTGFASFMITVEDDYPVVYLYEIHLAASLRGSGVGAHLMNLVEGIGRNASMEKSMLTVFTSNEGAERFYRKRGYETDEFSPQPRKLRGNKIKRPDYVILSKPLRGFNVGPLQLTA